MCKSVNFLVVCPNLVTYLNDTQKMRDIMKNGLGKGSLGFKKKYNGMAATSKKKSKGNGFCVAIVLVMDAFKH